MDLYYGKISLWLIMLLFASLVCGCAKQHYLIVQEDFIVLYYSNPDAKEVLFASSIDHFTLHPAVVVDQDLWQVTVPRRDTFSYFYLVDKVPTIPQCELTVADDFGARNCFFAAGM